MTDKRDGLEALFQRHSKEAKHSDFSTTREIALSMVKDSDGDYALVKVDRKSGEVDLLGWMKDEEAAHTLSDLINSLARGDATAKESYGDGEVDRIMDAIRDSGKVDL